MKKYFVLVCIALLFWQCKSNCKKEVETCNHEDMAFHDTTESTNNFYDDAATKKLGVQKILVSGEVKEEVTVDLANLPLRSVIVKETVLDTDSSKFIGAYRYDGYSLFDILNKVKIEKKTKKFNPIIDLYVLVTNKQGDSVIFSWGEIFYPIHRHEILVASQVMRIVPSKTKELWPLPDDPRIVAGADLLTERNISNPSKIEILTAPKQADESKKGIFLSQESFLIKDGDEVLEEISEFPDHIIQTYPTVFYGRGKGIHGVREFIGPELQNFLKKHFDFTKENIQKAYFIISAPDDYHGVFTFSEIFNRNDQSSFLLTEKAKEKNGYKFTIYPAPDFFSDRAIKGVSEIRFEWVK